MCPFFLSYNGVGVIYVGPIVSFSSVPRTMECALDVPLALLYHFYCWRIRDCIYHTMKCPLQMPTTWIHKWYWSKFSNDPVHTVHILKVLSGQVYQISNQLWNIACSSLFSQWSQSAYCQYLTGRSWTLSTRFKHFGVFHDPTIWRKYMQDLGHVCSWPGKVYWLVYAIMHAWRKITEETMGKKQQVKHSLIILWFQCTG